ncbi:hypothetical protein [Paenibacillus macerans]|uniref:Uncharacterized protein n=1 Tax=Paenibacillus macerans TaxID=44252 RepID=A0A090Y3Y2_PAEMA|nr:hypothetical protein [Paenibacillus macerans]KFM92931.1 hypothetical protein DJ90_2976 [Paenibacillus macerans]MCY7561580.1 hypothetical protein [Paenibacillus macerans]MEC0153321.1 hypothetical protein [Paenibacillus macerans]SUA84824.1 Uncharacterised protein [Paenibacillus macerans]
MARSRDEVRAELRRLFQEGEQDRVELEDILLEHDGKLLVRKTSLMRLGDARFWGECFEIWTDASKYKGQPHGDAIQSYCTHRETAFSVEGGELSGTRLDASVNGENLV